MDKKQEKLKPYFDYDDSIATCITRNISLKTGEYKNNIQLVKITKNLESLLNNNPEKRLFTRKELSLPRSWYTPLELWMWCGRNYRERCYDAKQFCEEMKKNFTPVLFEREGLLLPITAEITTKKGLRYYYSRRDIQSLYDLLSTIIENGRESVKREAYYCSLELQDLQDLLAAIN